MSLSSLGKRKRDATDGHLFAGRNFISGSSQLHQGDIYHVTKGSDLTDEQKCVQAFYTGQSYQKYKDINALRAENTCLWVLNHPQFIKWRDDVTETLLWISADPGCGKSVLSRSLIDRDLRDEGRTLCFFFFKDNDDQNDLPEALCALLHQLFTKLPALIGHAMLAYKQHGAGIRQELNLMWSILLSALSDPKAGKVTIILDALDECRDADRRYLITRLCEFREAASLDSNSVGTKFLITSRPYDSVQRWFEDTVSSFPQVRLRGEDENEQINKEIDIVIDHQVSKLGKEFDLSRSHQQALKDRLIRMQHRTYLWLNLAMEEIREAFRLSLTPEDVEIKSLSRDINEAYETILSKIRKGEQEKQAKRVFTVILGARRPLSLAEMASALSAYIAHEKSSTKLPEVQTSRLQRLIREWCGLFVFIQDSKLFLIHQTAREFLLSELGDHTPTKIANWQHSFKAASLDHTMAHVCMTYLLLAPNGRTNDCSDTDFVNYCIQEWTWHLADEDLQDDPKLLQRFLKICNPSRGSVVEENALNNADRLILRFAQEGRSKLLQIMSSNYKCRINVRDKFERHVLSIAAFKGFQDIVEWSLAEGALIDAVDRDGCSALMNAAWRGHLSIVQMLLKNGACVELADYHSRTALLSAASAGHAQITRAILQRGKEAASTNMRSHEAFSIAVVWGNIDVLEVILQHDPEAVSLGGALVTATYCRNLETARWLLKKGAYLEATDCSGQTPLIIATENLHLDMMQLLVADGGANINAQDKRGQTSLHVAVKSSFHEGVKLLTDAGADVKLVDGIRKPALQDTSRAKDVHEEIPWSEIEKWDVRVGDDYPPVPTWKTIPAA